MNAVEAVMSPQVVTGYRFDAALPILGADMRHAGYDDLVAAGLQELMDRGLCTTISKAEGNTMVAWSGNARVSPLQHLVGLFPDRGVLPFVTVDDFGNAAVDLVSDTVNRSVRAVDAVSRKRHMPVRRTFVVQHIAPYEDYHDRPNNATFTQFHMHVIPDMVRYEHGQRVLSSEESSLFLREQAHKRLLHEPLYFFMQELVSHDLPDVLPIPSISSFLIRNKNNSLFLDSDDVRDIGTVMLYWKRTYGEIALCFTDFAQDNSGRYVPISEAERVDRVAAYVDRHPYISGRTQRFLGFLAHHVTQADWEGNGYWSSFYKGIAGSLILAFDPVDGLSICVSPRVSISADKFVSAPYGDRVFIKDRERDFDAVHTDALMDIQRDLMARIGKGIWVQ